MNAWHIHSNQGIDALAAVSQPVPDPGPHDVVVRVGAVSLNYRDLLHVLGVVDDDCWPLVPCSDGAGEIVSVGSEVSRFSIGDHVAGTLFEDWISA